MKTKRSSRVEKTPVPVGDTEPADDRNSLVSTALPVLAVMVLLIVAIAYRVRRASVTKAEITDSRAEPPPAAENNSLELEGNEPIEEALSADLEFQTESKPEDRISGDDGDSSTRAVSVYPIVA